MSDRTCKAHRDATVTYGTRYESCPLCRVNARIALMESDLFCSIEIDEVRRNPEAFARTAERVQTELEHLRDEARAGAVRDVDEIYQDEGGGG